MTEDARSPTLRCYCEEDLEQLGYDGWAAEEDLAGFGAVRARRGPLPMCRVEVDPCYTAREDAIGCINPEFYELPAERPSFRVFAQVRR